MSDETYRITEDGIAEAISILERDQYATFDPALEDFENLSVLKKAATEYIAASVAKGEKRSNAECREAFIIGYFDAWLEDVIRRQTN